MKTEWVFQLSEENRMKLEQRLREILTDESDIYSAMNGRLCDIEDTIDITEFL